MHVLVNLFEKMENWEPTVAEIAAFLTAQGVPSTAKLEYGDCGSHDLWVTWDEDPATADLAPAPTNCLEDAL